MTDSLPPTITNRDNVSKHLQPAQTMKIDGPADVIIESQKPPIDLNKASGQVEVKPFFGESEITSTLPLYTQGQENSGQFKLASEEKPGAASSLLSNEDRDISNKLNGSQWETSKDISGRIGNNKGRWGEKLSQFKESHFLTDAQHKLEQTGSQIAGKAKQLKQRGQDKLNELQQRRKSTARTETTTTATTRVQERRELKWADILPYLLPLIILTLGIISGVGLWRALMHRSAGPALLKPVLNDNADFIPNPMMQTPYHLHDDDPALKREDLPYTQNTNQDEAGLMDKIKFNANLYAHHAQDIAMDSANAVKDELKDIAGHAKMSVDNAINYVSQKANFFKDSGSELTETTRDSIWEAKDREAIEAEARYRGLVLEVEDARNEAQAKAHEAMQYLSQKAGVPTYEHPPIHNPHRVPADVPPQQHHLHGQPL